MKNCGITLIRGKNETSGRQKVFCVHSWQIEYNRCWIETEIFAINYYFVVCSCSKLGQIIWPPKVLRNYSVFSSKGLFSVDHDYNTIFMIQFWWFYFILIVIYLWSFLSYCSLGQLWLSSSLILSNKCSGWASRCWYMLPHARFG